MTARELLEALRPVLGDGCPLSFDQSGDDFIRCIFYCEYVSVDAAELLAVGWLVRELHKAVGHVEIFGEPGKMCCRVPVSRPTDIHALVAALLAAKEAR